MILTTWTCASEPDTRTGSARRAYTIEIRHSVLERDDSTGERRRDGGLQKTILEEELEVARQEECNLERDAGLDDRRLDFAPKAVPLPVVLRAVLAGVDAQAEPGCRGGGRGR